MLCMEEKTWLIACNFRSDKVFKSLAEGLEIRSLSSSIKTCSDFLAFICVVIRLCNELVLRKE